MNVSSTLGHIQYWQSQTLYLLLLLFHISHSVSNTISQTHPMSCTSILHQVPFTYLLQLPKSPSFIKAAFLASFFFSSYSIGHYLVFVPTSLLPHTLLPMTTLDFISVLQSLPLFCLQLYPRSSCAKSAQSKARWGDTDWHIPSPQGVTKSRRWTWVTRIPSSQNSLSPGS